MKTAALLLTGAVILATSCTNGEGYPERRKVIDQQIEALRQLKYAEADSLDALEIESKFNKK